MRRQPPPPDQTFPLPIAPTPARQEATRDLRTARVRRRARRRRPTHRRFADATLDLFARHDLEPLGFWHLQEDPGRIIYLLGFPDEETRQRSWASFREDEDWQRVKQESEAEGPIMTELISRVLVAPDYVANGT